MVKSTIQLDCNQLTSTGADRLRFQNKYFTLSLQDYIPSVWLEVPTPCGTKKPRAVLFKWMCVGGGSLPSSCFKGMEERVSVEKGLEGNHIKDLTSCKDNRGLVKGLSCLDSTLPSRVLQAAPSATGAYSQLERRYGSGWGGQWARMRSSRTFGSRNGGMLGDTVHMLNFIPNSSVRSAPSNPYTTYTAVIGLKRPVGHQGVYAEVSGKYCQPLPRLPTTIPRTRQDPTTSSCFTDAISFLPWSTDELSVAWFLLSRAWVN